MISSKDSIQNSRIIRTKVIDMAYNSGKAAHLGGSLSVVDILSVLYTSVLQIEPERRMEPNRNRFILSKGHAALALFATLNVFGFINDEKIRTYMQHDSHLIAHPIKDLTLGVESSNGSLGQGLSFGAGIAIAAQIQKKNFAVYVVLGDGECNEGSVWEAALFAGAKNLDNLVAIVDLNNLQSDGEAIDRASHQQLLDRWVSFGWDAVLIDGHNHRELLDALTARRQGKPKCIIAQTVKGKGVKFMETDNNWHHAILSKQKFAEALRDLQ